MSTVKPAVLLDVVHRFVCVILEHSSNINQPVIASSRPKFVVVLLGIIPLDSQFQLIPVLALRLVLTGRDYRLLAAPDRFWLESLKS